MSGVVSMERASRQGQFSILQFAPPGGAVHDIGVILTDAAGGRADLRLRGNWEEIADEFDAALLGALEADLRGKIEEMGGERVLHSLEDSLSGVLRISDREQVAVPAFSLTLDRLYREHVGELEVRPFETHLPLYTLAAAASNFGVEMPSEPEDWVRAEPMRLNAEMFVAHVVGTSMEPRIPDGSLNIFRYGVVGSRQNKIVLVERAGSWDELAKYTIKKYTSTKRAQNGGWEHERIRMEPLNPEFEGFDLAEGDRVIAEWLQVLD